jgi:chloramphenicol O-acetyltransferase type A
MKLWFSLIEYDPLCSFEKMHIRNGKNSNNNRSIYPRTLNTTMLFIFGNTLNFYFTLACKELHFPDSCPKISFGKMIMNDGTKTMAMSIHVHHGLTDYS